MTAFLLNSKPDLVTIYLMRMPAPLSGDVISVLLQTLISCVTEGEILYKNQRAYLAILVGDIKGLMILKNVLSCSKPSYRSVQISPRFL